MRHTRTTGMLRHFQWATFALLSILVSALTAAPARANLVASVTAVVTADGVDGYLYTYTVAVDPTSTTSVGEFDLNITSGTTSGIITPVGAPLANIDMPLGFINLYTLGDPTISFFSTDASTDIAPGASETFSFTSINGPGTLQAWNLTSFDLEGSSIGGTVIAPTTPTPEPSSLVLCGLGIVGYAAARVYGGARKRVA